MRILLIDDEPAVTERLALYLEDESHHVKILSYVPSQNTIQDILKDFSPDGISLDLDMAPRGDRIYGWIRKCDASVPIIFYTKYARSVVHRERMFSAGALERHILPKVEARDDVERLLRAFRGH